MTERIGQRRAGSADAAALEDGRRGNIGIIALAPVPALLLGVLVMVRGGVGPMAWGQNLAALILGLTGVWIASRRRSAWTRRFVHRWLIPVAVMGLIGTLLAADYDGVHRWLGMGPVRLHVAALMLPAVLIALRQRPLKASVAIGLIIAAILWLQPDLAQAVAFALAWALIVLAEHARRAIVPAIIVVGIALTVALQPDPLQPVAHVEQIVGMAFGQGSVLGVAAVASLALFATGFLLCRDRTVGSALTVYMVATLGAAWYGHFPVPILGYGMSPILGYYLAVATLVMVEPRPTPHPRLRAKGRSHHVQDA